MYNLIWAVLAGFLLDLIFGDPHWLYHPVRLIGLAITKLEPILRKIFPKHRRGTRAAGACCALIVVALTTGCVWGILRLAGALHPALAFAVETFLCYQALATKSLRDESGKVYTALKSGDLAAARSAVSMIVGRDTARLDVEQVTKAAVETVAENAADGVIAPLLFLAIGGAPLGFFYKAINTLDSMIGYKNERYLEFGRFAAKLDDAANFIPARLSGLLMAAAAFLCGLDGRGAYRIWRRDRRNHPSPNSAQTEAACAGALGVQLAGGAYYSGVWFDKPTIGDALRPVEPEDILRANRLLYGTAALAMAFLFALRLLIRL